MSRMRVFLGMLVLTTSIFGCAQKSDSKAAEASAVTSGVAPSAQAVDPCASGKRLQEAEILTDTMGVDFGPYMKQVVKTVRQNWYNLMPPSVYPPISKQGKVAIEFVVQKDGKIDKMKIDTASGDEQLDRAAWGSIIGSSPLPSLPKEFPGPNLGLRLYYFYNVTPDNTRIYITPCVDVRVPAGSTQQFSVPIGGTERAAVTWSVSGPGCVKAACGSISENGLYTAPADIPEPPIVFVEATPQSNRSLPPEPS
jgi:TonB family protein